MIAYKYLMNKIYPTRVNDESYLLYYKELIKAHFKLINSSEDEILLLNYRNAFTFFRNQVYNAVSDGFRKLENEMDDFDKLQFEQYLKKLKKDFYNMGEIFEIISFINLILHGYNTTPIKRIFNLPYPLKN